MQEDKEKLKAVEDTTFQQENLLLLINHIAKPILWLDSSNNLWKFNKTAKSIFQLSQKNIGQLFTHLCSQLKMECPLAENGTQQHSISEFYGPDQHYIIKWTSLPLLTKQHHQQATLLIGEDLARDTSVKSQFNDIKAYCDSIIQSLPNIVYWKDRNGLYRGGNAGAVDLAGASNIGNFIGRTDFDFAKTLGWDLSVAEKFREDDEAVAEKQVASYQIEELPFKRPDGSIIYEISNKAPWIDTKGKVLGTVGVSLDITKLVEAKKKLKHIAKKNQIILNSTAEAIYGVDKKGKITFINPIGADLIKKKKRDLIGKSHHEIFHQENHTHKVDCPICQSLTNLEEQHAYATTFTRTDGTNFKADIVSTPIIQNNNLSGAVITCRDVTSQHENAIELERLINQRTIELSRINRKLTGEIYLRRQVEQELKESENSYKTLTTISPVCIVHLDINGHCSYANQYTHKILGLMDDAIPQKKWHRYIHRGDLKTVFSELKRAISKNDNFKQEFRLITADNSRHLWVFGQAILVKTENGKPSGFICTITDLTKLRDSEKLIREHQSKLAHFSRVNTIGEMASGLAHELNQPLTSIVQYIGGSIQRLKSEGLSDKVISALEQASYQAERAGKIIHHMKSFLRKGQVHKTFCNLNLIIDNVMKILELETAKTKAMVKLHLSPSLKPIFVDQIQIEQVILNIAHNAIEAMNQTSISKRQLTIKTCMNTQDLIKITIIDTGLGIDAAIKDKVFNPFFTTKPNGMGIGLSLAHSTIECHGGRIWLNSYPNQGTEFTIILPTEEE